MTPFPMPDMTPPLTNTYFMLAVYFFLRLERDRSGARMRRIRQSREQEDRAAYLFDTEAKDTRIPRQRGRKAETTSSILLVKIRSTVNFDFDTRPTPNAVALSSRGANDRNNSCHAITNRTFSKCTSILHLISHLQKEHGPRLAVSLDLRNCGDTRT